MSVDLFVAKAGDVGRKDQSPLLSGIVLRLI